jgi:hypothetical protein
MKLLPTDDAGIDEAVARVREITNRLNNAPRTPAIDGRGAENRILDDSTLGSRMGINSEGVSTVIAGHRITSRQKEDIIRRLEELKALLDKMKSGKDHKTRIRVLVDSFRGAETAIRTLLIANRFIAQIMSR